MDLRFRYSGPGSFILESIAVVIFERPRDVKQKQHRTTAELLLFLLVYTCTNINGFPSGEIDTMENRTLDTTVKIVYMLFLHGWLELLVSTWASLVSLAFLWIAERLVRITMDQDRMRCRLHLGNGLCSQGTYMVRELRASE